VHYATRAGFLGYDDILILGHDRNVVQAHPYKLLTFC
jgi:hypothetical protein